MSGAPRRWAPGAPPRVRFRGALHPAGSTGGGVGATVTIVPQEMCHFTEMELPAHLSSPLEQVLRLNLPSHLPGGEFHGVAWERMVDRGEKRLYAVWAWRERDDGVTIPEGRLVRLALARNGWAFAVQPRGERINLYLRQRDGRFQAYTFIREGFSERLGHALRAAGLAPGDGVQLVEPGESPIELPAEEPWRQLRLDAPLAPSLWRELTPRQRFAVAPGLAAALAGRITGPLLLATAALLGLWLGGVVGDWREARRVAPLSAELDRLRDRSAAVRDALERIERRGGEWAALRDELARNPPLAELLAAVAPVLGEGGRIHSVEFTLSGATVTGLAREATLALHAVERMAALRDARFGSDLSRDPERGLEHFRIEARWPGAEDAEPANGARSTEEAR